MNIIEKLGMKKEYITSMVNGDVVRKLEKEIEDFIERDIKFLTNIELRIRTLEEQGNTSDAYVCRQVLRMFCFKPDEKAIGKSLSEVKALYDLL